MENLINIDVGAITEIINNEYDKNRVDALARAIFANGYTRGVIYGMQIARHKMSKLNTVSVTHECKHDFIKWAGIAVCRKCGFLLND